MRAHRLVLLVAALAVACADSEPPPDPPGGEPAAPAPPIELGRHSAAVTETRRIVPGPGLPPEAPPQNSNNNLDVVRHEGRVFLAWRTAPDHFASDSTAMYVISSEDEASWRVEARFTAGADLREPRFLVLGGSLFLYMARLGKDRDSFDPQGMSYARRPPGGVFSEAREFYKPGYIPWRARSERGVPYLSTYVGGEHIYRFDGLPLSVELLTTDDGVSWRGVDPAMPEVSRGGGSETDFVITDGGDLLAVVRNEAGDDTGWGSKVCRADAGAITRWRCKSDPRKYDSPLMFYHDGEAYLIARRNVSETGSYDLMMRQQNRTAETLAYQLDYRTRAKRCSLWRYDQASDRVVYILDLPSRGDTCFPALLRGSRDGEYIIYNYSSDIDGPDVSWLDGQSGPTYIYRHVLRLSRRGP